MPRYWLSNKRSNTLSMVGVSPSIPVRWYRCPLPRPKPDLCLSRNQHQLLVSPAPLDLPDSVPPVLVTLLTELPVPILLPLSPPSEPNSFDMHTGTELALHRPLEGLRHHLYPWNTLILGRPKASWIKLWMLMNLRKRSWWQRVRDE